MLLSSLPPHSGKPKGGKWWSTLPLGGNQPPRLWGLDDMERYNFSASPGPEAMVLVQHHPVSYLLQSKLLMRSKLSLFTYEPLMQSQ